MVFPSFYFLSGKKVNIMRYLDNFFYSLLNRYKLKNMFLTIIIEELGLRVCID